ncbi:dnaJ homolog subfamily C member 11-like [Haliotis asinina]|uniref:dnaJ homolog subfamily C member 11-like n=1 Tax=Haliotis asinina TaxID=109174 RepID=UPI003531C907
MAAPLEDDEDPVSENFYSLLNVATDASTDEINYAFRRLSKTYHPDKHTDPVKKKKAEVIFNKLKRANEVLKDRHKRAIYDMYGEKGLETEGLEVISRTKSPAEIIAEYERLQREREERRLQQRTNPRGNVTVGINATDLFDSYSGYESDPDYGQSTVVEMSSMSISQSVECPLTVKDTAIISGNLSTQNGTGTGAFVASWRRLTSDKGWMELETVFGNGLGGSIKGFRQLTRRCYGTCAASLQGTSRSLRPILSSTIAYQFDRHLQGRMTWNMGFQSSMTTALVYDSQQYHSALMLMIGMRKAWHIQASVTRKFQEHEAKLRVALKIGSHGYLLEYGFEKKITQFSFLGATMGISVPHGIHLRVKLFRGTQTFLFPIHLSETLSPSAVFYGTVLPVVAFFVVRNLIVNPFLRQQKEKELEKTRREHSEKLAQRKTEAEAAVELMKETVERSVEAEEKKGGLVIVKGLYGKLITDDDGELIDRECLDVSIPLQALVKESKLILPENTTKSGLPGFYDPVIGETKTLFIRYKFRHRFHQVTLADTEPIRLPQQKHLIKDELTSSSSRS